MDPLTAQSTSPVPVASPPPGMGERLATLSPKHKWLLGIGIAALVAIIVAMALWSRTGNYKVLYANLADKDGAAIVAQLAQMNVPYQYTEGGGAIMVPADRVHDVRLKLASAGLPKGSVMGYELMETQRFGATQFQERLNFQRGLEGELVRSIQGIDAVAAARVHLALPHQNGFFREQQKPSASVILTLHPGRSLDRQQTAGIVHLVASSVPELTPKAVSVLDQSGALLSTGEDSPNNGLDAQQLHYVRQIEAHYTKRVMDILEPILGHDNLRAQVTAEIDFSQTEQTSEEFKPNQSKDTAAIRSQQTSESATPGSATPAGVPGAMSNQPPAPATAPINGAAAPLQAANTGSNGSGPVRRDATTNYEVDRTVRVTRAGTGIVRRLNAAVVVNNISKTDAKGKTSSSPMSPEELNNLTALVKETVGFNAERGDSVKLINAPFHVDKVTEEPIPLWQRPEIMDMLRMGVVPTTLILLALMVIFGAIRPALKAIQTAPPAPQLETVVDDEHELPGVTTEEDTQILPALEAPQTDKRLDDARQLAKDNPAAMANLVRNWVNNGS